MQGRNQPCRKNVLVAAADKQQKAKATVRGNQTSRPETQLKSEQTT